MESRPSRLPPGIWVLGFVSLLMDVSSELIHSLLPVFLVSTLGASAAVLGLVEGVAEATALVVKVFSGTLSDLLGRRKPLALLGYALGAASKPAFALATSVPWVLAARFTDRVGKGLRGAPRDALIADLTTPAQRGRAYGLRQALDTVGAVLGPILALALMAVYDGDIRRVFWIAVIPGTLSVLLLAAGVSEPERPARPAASRPPIDWRALSRLGAPYWRVVAFGALFTLARLSEAFLILRGLDLGLSLALAPAALIVMNVVYAAAAYPAGAIADRIDHRGLLAAGMAALLVSQLALAGASGLGLGALGAALWGLHLALTQGLLAALVADAVEPELRGTAFGIFNLASGAAMLAAGVATGLLWDRFGAPAAFIAGAAVSAASLLWLSLDRGSLTAP